jgi:hemoglobin
MHTWIRKFFVTVLGLTMVASAAQPSFAGQAEVKGKTETKGKVQMGGEKSLYDRLGGKKAITAVVDEFVANVAADARINKFFVLTASDPKRMATFKGNLVDQICQAGGGPCTYAGKSMKEAHAGMGISTADFNALVEDLVKALDKLKVGEKEKNELLSVLGPMKSDIVEKP